MKLGFWQLDRAEQKRQLQTQYESQEKLPAIVLGTDINQQLSPYSKVVVKGQYDTTRFFLFDNKTYQGKPGYQVLSPIKINGVKNAILVNRGWVPMGKSRNELPSIEIPIEVLNVTGRIKKFDGEQFRLSEDNIAGQSWPLVIQWIDFEAMEKRLGYSLLPYIILQDPENQNGFVRDWYIKKITPEKNTSYAVQWFMLATALIVIFIVVNLRKVEKSE